LYRHKIEISDAEEPLFRIEGGTSALINKLTTEIGIEHIKTSTKIISIKEENKN
jgi:monoamine oxidase